MCIDPPLVARFTAFKLLWSRNLRGILRTSVEKKQTLWLQLMVRLKPPSRKAVKAFYHDATALAIRKRYDYFMRIVGISQAQHFHSEFPGF